MATGMVMVMAMVKPRRNSEMLTGRLRRGRAITATIVAVVIAAGMFLQAASGVLSLKNPELAVSLWPNNGIALEQAAYRQFAATVDDPEQLQQPAERALQASLKAFDALPLAPKAHALIALAETRESVSAKVVTAATALNRRDLVLQSVALDLHVGDQNYPRSLATLDHLLRVHPELQEAFFPVLDQAFGAETTLPEFDKVLDGTSVWHDQYLDHVVLQDQLLPNLATFRTSYRKPDPELDRMLIERLSKIGAYDEAIAIYRSLPNVAEVEQANSGMISWSDSYPPIDWLFMDERDIRAQRVVSGNDLEVYAKSGVGGLVAERIIRPETRKFQIAISHDLAIDRRKEPIRVQVRCAQADDVIVSEPLQSQSAKITVDLGETQCATYLLGINLRAWRGKPAIRGTLKPLIISPIR